MYFLTFSGSSTNCSWKMFSRVYCTGRPCKKKRRGVHQTKQGWHPTQHQTPSLMYLNAVINQVGERLQGARLGLGWVLLGVESIVDSLVGDNKLEGRITGQQLLHGNAPRGKTAPVLRSEKDTKNTRQHKPHCCTWWPRYQLQRVVCRSASSACQCRVGPSGCQEHSPPSPSQSRNCWGILLCSPRTG